MKYISFLFNKLKFLFILKDYFLFKVIARGQSRFSFRFLDIWPCPFDKTSNTGYDRHYIYHPAWAARVLSRTQPAVHVDISSLLNFSTLISAFVPVEFYDYRPAEVQLDHFSSNKQDLMKLTFADNSIKSLSCMHTVEHVGLGRYGDKMDYNGDLKAMQELARVLSIGGQLIFVVPVGRCDMIQFNAHRVYTRDTVVNEFSKLGLVLKEFTLIPEKAEDGALVTNPSDQLLQKQKYACGCFLFSKEN
mgnify:CR=1 FL=1